MADDGENADGDVVQSVVLTTEVSVLPRLLTVEIPPRNGYLVSTSEQRYLTSVWDAFESGKNLCVQIPTNPENFELLVSFIMSYHASALPNKVPCNFVLVISGSATVEDGEKIFNEVRYTVSDRLQGLEDFSVVVLTGYDMELHDDQPSPNVIICSSLDVLGMSLFRYLGKRISQYTVIFDEVQNLDIQINHLSSLRVTAHEVALFVQTLDRWIEPDPSLKAIPAYTFFPNYIPVEVGGAVDSAALGSFADFLFDFYHQCLNTPDRATWADFLVQYDGHNIAVALEDLRFSLAWLEHAWQGGSGVNDRFFQFARFTSLLGHKMQSYDLYYDAEKEELQFEFSEPSIYMHRLQNSRSIILTSRSSLNVCHLVLLEGNALILNLLEDWVWPINRPFTSVFLTHYTSSGSNRALFGRSGTDAKYDVNMVVYGLLIADISRICHLEGILCLFPSFQTLVLCYKTWQHFGTLKEIKQLKNVHWQSDLVTTLTNLERYHKDCDAGRGAVFLAVARDHDNYKFSERYGRVVVFMGFPFLTKASRSLLARAIYWRDRYNINLDSVLSFFIQRYASESIGRQIMASNLDNIIVVFADFCYGQRVNQHMLPPWMFLSRNDNADVNENDNFIVNNADRFAQILESLRRN